MKTAAAGNAPPGAETTGMKLGVSTLGCPDWTLGEILSRCKAYGYDGIEWRGLGPDLDFTQSPAFATPAAVTLTRQAHADAGLEICGLDSSAHSPIPRRRLGRKCEHARRMIDLAAALGAPLSVSSAATARGGNRGVTARASRTASPPGGLRGEERRGVSVVLETHDAFSTGVQVAEALRLGPHPQVGAFGTYTTRIARAKIPTQTWDASARMSAKRMSKIVCPVALTASWARATCPSERCSLSHTRRLRRLGQPGMGKTLDPPLADPEVAFPQYARILRQYLAD